MERLDLIHGNSNITRERGFVQALLRLIANIIQWLLS
jgi:hypothetical protein